MVQQMARAYRFPGARKGRPLFFLFVHRTIVCRQEENGARRREKVEDRAKADEAGGGGEG